MRCNCCWRAAGEGGEGINTILKIKIQIQPLTLSAFPKNLDLGPQYTLHTVLFNTLDMEDGPQRAKLKYNYGEINLPDA